MPSKGNAEDNERKRRKAATSLLIQEDTVVLREDFRDGVLNRELDNAQPSNTVPICIDIVA